MIIKKICEVCFELSSCVFQDLDFDDQLFFLLMINVFFLDDHVEGNFFFLASSTFLFCLVTTSCCFLWAIRVWPQLIFLGTLKNDPRG